MGHNRHGRKDGGCCVPLAEGELGLHLTQCVLDRGLPPYEWHLDPSNRLAPIHQRHRQTGHDRTDNGPIRQDEPFYTRSPKTVELVEMPFGMVTGQLADTPTRRLPTRGLDISRTGQLAD